MISLMVFWVWRVLSEALSFRQNYVYNRAMFPEEF